MTPAIDAVDAWEVLDSRGDPTVRVAVTAGDARGLFTVPVGASTGRHEAVEVRDGGDRYDGRGVRTAVRAVRDDLEPVVTGRDVTAQRAVDAALVERDGTAYRLVEPEPDVDALFPTTPLDGAVDGSEG